MGLLILFYMLLSSSFKMTTSFTNIVKTTASTGNLYTKDDFKSSGLGFLFEKSVLILNEVETSLMFAFSLKNSLASFETLLLLSCYSLPIDGN